MDKKAKLNFEGKHNAANRSFSVDEDMEGWAIFNETGVGRWLGRIEALDTEKRLVTLWPGFEMSSPSRTPVLQIDPRGGTTGGVLGGADVDYVFNQVTTHPIRDMAYSHFQNCNEMSEDGRIALFQAILHMALGPVDPVTGKRAGRQ